MSEASKLLKSLSDVEYESYSAASPVNDVIEIDANGRFINIPRTEVLLGVETDKDVERKYFRCPRIVGDNIDLTKLQLRVNYQNAEQEKDAHIVQDVTVDGQYINFSWKLSDKVLAAQGTVFFAIQAVSSEQDGTLKNRWNTTLASGNVLETLIVELDYYEEEQARELLTELLQMMDNKYAESIQKIQNETNTQLGRINTTGTQQVQAVADEGVRVLESIPADYQETYKMADEGIRTKVDAFTNELESQDTIVLTNAANDPLRGLKLYGKTKQATTNGHQLFDASRLTTRTGGNVTLTNHGDGSFTISGSGSAGDFGRYYNLTHEETLALFKVGTLYLANDTITYPYFYVETVVNNNQLSVVTNSGSIELTQDFFDNATSFIRIGFYGGSKNITTGTIKPMLYQEGDGTWEPFSGGYASPNPDYPQELDSLGELWNLFNKDSITDNHKLYTGDVLQDTTRFVSDYIDCKEFTHISINLCASYAWYDNAFNKVSSEEKTMCTFRCYQKPTGARYVRLDFNKTDIAAKDVMVVGGEYSSETIPSYRPYTGQKEIESVVRGKNLFGGEVLADEIVRNGGVNRGTTVEWSCADVPNNGVINVGFSFKENTPYTFIFYGKCKNPDYTTNMQITFTDDTKWNVTEFVKNNELSYSKTTTPQNKTVKELRFVWATGGTILEQAKCGIFEGVVELEDFEPYCGKSLFTPVSSGLPGLPLGQTIPDVIKNSPAHMSGVYWDEEDQQYYISDTVDYESGKYEQRIVYDVLDGDETWIIEDKTYFINKKSTGSLIEDVTHKYANSSVGIVHYTVVDNGGYGFVCAYGWRINFENMNVANNTVDELKAYLAKNPITAMSVLATPTTRDLTATEMAAYRALRTNKPTTVIFNDCKARMGVKYNVDLESRMDENAAEERHESDLKYGGAIVQTIQGEALVATDSAKAPFLGMKLFGKTEQFTTSGKNLVPSVAISQKIDGITFTVNEDKSVTVDGTATAVVYIMVAQNLILKAEEEYILSGTPKNLPTGCNMYFYNIATSEFTFDNGDGVNISFTTDVQGHIYIRIAEGSTLNNATFYPMLRKAEITDATYEPYTGGQPSPSPDYPQELKSAGQASGQIESSVRGCQLFDASRIATKSAGGATVTNNGDGSFTVSGSGKTTSVLAESFILTHDEIISLFKAGVLYLKSEPLTSPYFYLECIQNGHWKSGLSGDSRLTITQEFLDDNTSFVKIGFYTDPDEPIVPGTIKPMLYQDGDGTWEPYKEPQSLITKTPNGLPGIPLGATIPDVIQNSPIHMSGVWWDSDEEQYYISDTVDRESGKYMQRIWIQIFDGIQGYIDSFTSLTNHTRLLGYIKDTSKRAITHSCLCNRLKKYSSYDGDFEHLYVDNYAIWLFLPNDKLSQYTNVSEYLKDYPLIVQYILAEPIIRDLTKEELKAFKELRSNYPTTTIMNDANAHMEASYVVDTKTYIDKKFAELAARLSTQS